MGLGQRIKYFFTRKLASIIIKGILLTCRKKVRGEGIVRELRDRGVPLVYAHWHRHIIFNLHQFKNRGVRPLISMSSDGELIAQIAGEFGMYPVRGSSSRGGARAFLKLVAAIKKESSEILITADGPKGPARQVKDGTIVLAQKTGAEIVPVSWRASKQKVLEKTWDKFIIPLPFSTITFAYGTPLKIPAKLTKEEVAGYGAALKETLDDLEKSLE